MDMEVAVATAMMTTIVTTAAVVLVMTTMVAMKNTISTPLCLMAWHQEGVVVA